MEASETANLLTIKAFAPEVARHHQLEKTQLIEFDPRSPLQLLALRVIAERLENREAPAEFLNVTFQAA